MRPSGGLDLNMRVSFRLNSICQSMSQGLTSKWSDQFELFSGRWFVHAVACGVVSCSLWSHEDHALLISIDTANGAIILHIPIPV